MFTLIKKPPPPEVQLATIRRSVIRNVTPVLELHVETRLRVVEPEWENTPTNFDKEVEEKAKGLSFRVYVEAENAPSARIPVWLLLDEGTDVRYAQMEEGFKPQTARGIIRSSRRTAGVETIDTNQPHEGIEAREFDETINQALRPLMETVIDVGFKEGGRRI